MNGFGGDVEPKFSRVAESTTALLRRLGAIEPIDLESTLNGLGLGPETVQSAINAEFFPLGTGFMDEELAPDTAVREIVSEIIDKLARNGKN
jgi:hypothetical protein